MDADPQPTPPTPSENSDPTATSCTRGRNGKVARLPKLTRDKINTMILDGVPYLEIIQRLGPEAEGLLEKNLSTWKSGGYLDWLREIQITNAIQAKYELAQAIAANCPDDTAASQAVLHALAVNLLEFLADTDPTTIRESLLSDADKFTRFVNAMVRLAEGGIKCQLQKFRAQDRAADAAKQDNPTEKRGISDASLRTAEEKLNLL